MGDNKRDKRTRNVELFQHEYNHYKNHLYVLYFIIRYKTLMVAVFFTLFTNILNIICLNKFDDWMVVLGYRGNAFLLGIVLSVFCFMLFSIFHLILSICKTFYNSIIVLIMWLIIWYLIWSKDSIVYEIVERILAQNLKDAYVNNIYNITKGTLLFLGTMYLLLFIELISRFYMNNEARLLASASSYLSQFWPTLVGSVLFFNFPIFPEPGKFLETYILLFIIIFVPSIIFYYKYFNIYSELRKLIEISSRNKNGNSLTILLSETQSTIIPSFDRYLRIDDSTLKKIRASHFNISVQSVENIAKLDYSKEIILFVNDLMVFDNQIFSERISDFLHENQVFMCYEYLHRDMGTDGTVDVGSILKGIQKTFLQVDSRYHHLYEKSLGDAILKIISEEEVIAFRRKLDNIYEKYDKLEMSKNNLFWNVINEQKKNLYEKTDRISLLDFTLKYIEELNHFITLLVLEVSNYSVSDVLKRKSLNSKLRNATFGSWKDLQKNIYLLSAKNKQLSDVLDVMRLPLSNDLKQCMAHLMECINKKALPASNTIDLLDALVLFRNYTRGHGIFTYVFSEKLIYSLIDIYFHLSTIFDRLCSKNNVNHLDDLGWIIFENSNLFFLSSYDETVSELLFIDYITGHIIVKPFSNV